MKKYIITSILFLFFVNISFSQVLHLKNTKAALHDDYTKLNLSKNRTTNVPDILGTSLFITSLVINPDIIYENKKVNFGLTKEVSILMRFIDIKGFRALCRPGFEYTYVFRDGRNHHLRGFVNFEIPIETGDFIAITWGVGGGYFSDFKKSGAFPQTSLDAIIPVMDKFGLIPYLKLRHTFITDKTQSDITDFSIGMGFAFMPYFK